MHCEDTRDGKVLNIAGTDQGNGHGWMKRYEIREIACAAYPPVDHRLIAPRSGEIKSLSNEILSSRAILYNNIYVGRGLAEDPYSKGNGEGGSEENPFPSSRLYG